MKKEGGPRRWNPRKSQICCTDGNAPFVSNKAPPATCELTRACRVANRPSKSTMLPASERPDINPL
eukprot:2579706-Pyramimonas_sp.AAC.1